MTKKLIICLTAVLMLCIGLASATSFNTKIELELTGLTGISQLDNSAGDSVKVTIHTIAGAVVQSRDAATGVYKAGMVIPMTGAKFSMDYATDYTYNLSTTYGDFLYNFTTPAEGVDTSSGDAVASDILSGKKAWVDSSEITGTIANCATNDGGQCYVAQASKSSLDTDLTTGNIKDSVNIFGVTGNYEGVGGAELHTGQTTSYRTGDDADLDGTSKSYTDHGDGTVTDDHTGLMWTKADGGATTRVWNDAIDYCNALTTAGHTDWHLPTAVEGITMLDYGCAAAGGNCYSDFQNNALSWSTTSSYYWTSTTRPESTGYAYILIVDNGLVDNGVKTNTLYVRCVRSE